MAHLNGEARARYVAQMFARIAQRYDFLNTVITAGFHHRWRRAAARLAAPQGGWVLDVATGTGDLAFEVARQYPGCQVMGLDAVPQMLALARHKAWRRGLERRVAWLRGDALDLPFADGSLLAVTSGFSLRNLADLPRALTEMMRVTAPGGRVVLLEITPLRGPWPFRVLFGLYFGRMVPWLGALLSGDREAYTYLPESVRSFPHAEELAQLLREAGFREVGYRLVGLGTVAIHYGKR